MPSDYPCDVCQQTTADFMIAMIHNGDTVAVGIECIKKWATQVDKTYRDALKADERAAQVDHRQSKSHPEALPGPNPEAAEDAGE